jgi:5-methylcytosine-specific restriction endonuclease McrA
MTNDFPLRVVERVWKKQDGHCIGCGKRLFWHNRKMGEVAYWETHHRNPRSKGGSNLMRNCAILCGGCHHEIHPKGRNGVTLTKSIKWLQDRHGYHPPK